MKTQRLQPVLVSLAAAASFSGSTIADEPIRAVDCSFIPQIESLGGTFFVNGAPVDPIPFFAATGVNAVRLRVWHSPADGFCGTARTLAFAQRVRTAGLKLIIDFHYSDSWADPGQQTKPAAWASLTFPQLTLAVQSYSQSLVQALVVQGTPPDIVQIGNEITSGMLWNEGRISYWGDPNWQNLATLLRAGVNGVRAACPSARIMLHIDRGGDNAGTRAFFDRAVQYNVPFDIVGLSYYPWWHGPLEALAANLTDTAARYGKPVLIAETAYPWTLGWSDAQPNFVWQNSQLLSSFPADPSGQRAFLHSLFEIQRHLPEGRGAGVCYWAPEFSAFPGLQSPWENLALFDFSGERLPAWEAFLPFCSGDLTRDRLVDDADFAVFAAAYNTLDCADPAMPDFCPADLNLDDFVDDVDFVIFATSYDRLLCPSPAKCKI
ncbi:MAG: glycosyl hydrolase 53 family protein [Planctomycetes bacterium]|nr:glycosyl hydrolase 53 family protein [Planctomycetota bacterium]